MKLFYRQYGETGPAVFILHGIFGMLDNWHNIARMLSDRYRVFTTDARNHGQSPHSDEMSYKLMADDLKELMDDLGIASAVIIGHSMGGKTAMVFADTYPHMTEKLVVVDIAPKRYKPGHASYFKVFDDIDFSRFSTRKEVDDAFLPYESDAGVRLFLAKNIERGESGTYKLKSYIQGIKNGYDEIIGELSFSNIFNKPALFIKGSRSAYIQAYDEVEILKHFPTAVFEAVENAGHWVHADNPQGFTGVLTKFLIS